MGVSDTGDTCKPGYFSMPFPRRNCHEAIKTTSCSWVQTVVATNTVWRDGDVALVVAHGNVYVTSCDHAQQRLRYWQQSVAALLQGCP
jgi:hypothetical protein